LINIFGGDIVDFTLVQPVVIDICGISQLPFVFADWVDEVDYRRVFALNLNHVGLLLD
jgi:hypothetical protein